MVELDRWTSEKQLLYTQTPVNHGHFRWGEKWPKLPFFAEFGQFFGVNFDFGTKEPKKQKKKPWRLDFLNYNFSGASNRDPFYPLIGGHLLFCKGHLIIPKTGHQQNYQVIRCLSNSKLSSKKLSHENVSWSNIWTTKYIPPEVMCFC